MAVDHDGAALRRAAHLWLRGSVRRRILGDARTTSVTGVWTGEVASSLRRDIVAGGSKFCGDCPLKLPLKKDEAPPARPLDAGALPGRLYVECTAACNISCNQACCAPETGITRTRQAGMLDFDLFTRVIDEAGPSLGRVDFFNYGEAFLHKRAVEMCEYIKTKFPHIYLYTSTNGLALNEEKARRLVHSGIDEVTFSIDGASQDTYVQYRQRGDFAKALANLRAMADEKARHGRDVPHLNWRYILFKWNDHDEEMNAARRLAVDIGVDRLCWEITDHPEDSFSRRFRPGTDDYTAIETRSGTTTTWAMRSPGRRRARRLTCDAGARAADSGPARRDRDAADARHQPVEPAVRGAGQLRPPARAPGRAAVRGRRHAHRPRLREGMAAPPSRGRPAGRHRDRDARARRARAGIS